ncbi:dipeptide transport system permease protein [Renibacterium salmoninarum ATCC 33209]|uniref:Dipeptide transport system permease protein n=1 Tax=Renibacterium salmoninarum (strain ATCC 33209 / DSM 20767 / JCM 11484 / NBRC 15589 / NCIMB 2235) TaxID=288705 RepID=A9WTB2_RENSM|nr:dipeptide transport system permease protein [Renibacterium salmoninarum ATCC 33209]
MKRINLQLGLGLLIVTVIVLAALLSFIWTPYAPCTLSRPTDYKVLAGNI